MVREFLNSLSSYEVDAVMEKIAIKNKKVKQRCILFEGQKNIRYDLTNAAVHRRE